MAKEWYEYPDSVLALARFLVDEEDWSAKQVIWFFEKPWKWSDKWQEFQEWSAEEVNA